MGSRNKLCYELCRCFLSFKNNLKLSKLYSESSPWHVFFKDISAISKKQPLKGMPWYKCSERINNKKYLKKIPG